jgi:hypothetical protein
MSFVITTVRPESVTQISDTRESDFETQATISETMRKSLIFRGRHTHFVLGWVGLASTRFGHNTADWLFKTLVEMNARELNVDQIAGLLEKAATERWFGWLSTPEKYKHTAFTMAGWENGEPFVCIVSNYLTVCNSVSAVVDVRQHIPTVSESVTVAPRFTATIQRFRNPEEGHYLVHVMGDFDPNTLSPHFVELENLLKRNAPSEEIAEECRLTALEAAEHRRTVGKNLMIVGMDKTGTPTCTLCPADAGVQFAPGPPYISLDECFTQVTTNLITGEIRAKRAIIETASSR